MTAQEAYEAMLDGEISRAAAAGERTFLGLLRALAGTDPGTLLEFLKRRPTDRWAADLIRQATWPASPGLPARGVLLGTSPHPLDFDWRFTAASTADLWELAHAWLPPRGTALLLGTPSLFEAARRGSSGTPGVRHVLVDLNTPEPDAHEREAGLETFTRDLCRDPLPGDIQADVVITDPPWYAPETRAFLWAAAALCRAGGGVLACLPGLGTRPGMERERAALLRWADRTLGLECCELRARALRYDSPPFEQNAWRAAGLSGVPGDWRTGDLTIFRRRLGAGSLPPRPSGPWQPRWQSLKIWGVPLRLRPGSPKAGFADPSLVHLLPGDVLPSVSRRDPRRRRVDLWSGGNRVFGCRSPGVLGQIGSALAAASPVLPAVEGWLGYPLNLDARSKVSHAADQMLELVECERQETGATFPNPR